jgi:hypothetical protein
LEEGVKKWALQKSPSKEGRPHGLMFHVTLMFPRKLTKCLYVCNYYSTYVVYSSLVGSRTTNLCCVIINFFQSLKVGCQNRNKKQTRSVGWEWGQDKHGHTMMWKLTLFMDFFCCFLHFHSKKLK